MNIAIKLSDGFVSTLAWCLISSMFSLISPAVQAMSLSSMPLSNETVLPKITIADRYTPLNELLLKLKPSIKRPPLIEAELSILPLTLPVIQPIPMQQPTISSKDVQKGKLNRYNNRPCTDFVDTASLAWMDRTHQKLSNSLCKQVIRFDRFFGDVQYDEKYYQSFLRIRNSITWRNNLETELQFRPRVRGRIRLPNLKNRLNLIISDDSQNDNTLSTSNEVEPEQGENETENRLSTALRWIASSSKAAQIDVDIGARFDSGINLFSRARYRRSLLLDDDENLRFTQEIIWEASDGVGERSQFDYEKLLNKNWLFRWTTAGIFSETSQGFDWTQRITFLEQLGAKKAISYSIGANGFTRPIPVIDNYAFNMRYRQALYNNWLFGEIEPELAWPLIEDSSKRDFAPAITFRLEIQLGR